MPRRALAVLLAVAGLAAAAVAAPATAAPRGEQAPGCNSPTLTGPSALRSGDSFTIDGCGFAPGTLVPLEVTESGGCCVAYNIWADASGRFSITRAANGSGYYRVRASGQRRNGRWIVIAEWSANAS